MTSIKLIGSDPWAVYRLCAHLSCRSVHSFLFLHVRVISATYFSKISTWNIAKLQLGFLYFEMLRDVYIYIYVNYIHICAYEIILSSWGLFVAQVVLLVVLSVVCWSCHVDAQPLPLCTEEPSSKIIHWRPPGIISHLGGCHSTWSLHTSAHFFYISFVITPRTQEGPVGTTGRKEIFGFPWFFPWFSTILPSFSASLVATFDFRGVPGMSNTPIE